MQKTLLGGCLIMQSKYRGEPAAAHAEVLQYSDLPTADVEQLAVILLIFGNLSHITQISVNKKVFLQKFPLNFLHFVADLQELTCHDCSGHS